MIRPAGETQLPYMLRAMFAMAAMPFPNTETMAQTELDAGYCLDAPPAGPGGSCVNQKDDVFISHTMRGD